MEIVLLERVDKLGQMGDVVTVKDGYARNFLLPHNRALRATKANIERFERDRGQLEAESLTRRTEAEKVAKSLDGASYVLLRQASEMGQLYGSVTSRDIAAAITEGGITIDRRQVVLNTPIKNLGVHEVSVALHPEVSATATINVARSEEEAERQVLDAAEAEQVPVAEAIFETKEAAEQAKEELVDATREQDEKEPVAAAKDADDESADEEGGDSAESKDGGEEPKEES